MKYPFIPQLKLKFNIERITPLEPKAAIGLLISKLTELEYKILEETDRGLTFYNSPWKLRWNFQRHIALNGGNVEFTFSNNSNLVRLSYYLDYFPIVLISAVLIVSVISDRQYDAAIFFACFYFVAGAISIFRAKWEAKKILKEILNESGPPP